MEVIEDLTICVDCAQFHANGETPVELDEDATAAWLESLDDSGHWVVGEPYGFSAWPCCSCQSNLGGDRFTAAILIPA